MVLYNAIVCVDSVFGIGKNNTIPWKLKEEMKFFKSMTEHKTIVMGRNTYESIGKPLPNRINIVVSSTLKQSNTENLFIVPNIIECMILIETIIKPLTDVFIIGGSKIYKQFIQLKIVNNIYLNQINNYYDCDIHYDHSLHESNNYILTSESIKYHHDDITKQDLMVSYMIYKYHNVDEYKYLKLMDNIMKTGLFKDDRTNTGTLSLFGETIKYDVRNNIIPLLTTKRMFFRGIVEELLFFISGKTDSKILEQKGVNIWKGNTSRKFLDDRGLTNYKEGDMGPLYPFQLRHWGAEYKDCDTDYTGKGFDQLNNLINEIKTNPNSRRLMFSYWNPTDFTKTPIPTCFDENTMVLTTNGYKKISIIDKDDTVLSHSLNKRLVNNMQIKRYTGDMYYIKTSINDKPIAVTPNHPFIVNGKWVEAKDISINDKLTLRRVLPGTGLKTNKLFILLGYYYKLGFEKTILINNKMVFNKGIINSDIFIKHKINSKYDIFSSEFNLLHSKYIMEYSHYKQLKGSILLIGRMNIKYFMKGYLIACGVNGKRILENNYSNALLIQNLSYYINNTFIIRKFDSLYEMIPIENKNLKNTNAQVSIDSIKIVKNVTQLVYNIEVEVDNTYIVENISTHNCHVLYQYYTNPKDNELSCSFYCRSQDYCLGTPFNIASATILLNIICKMTGYKPGYLIHNMGDTHIYSTFLEKFKTQLTREAYNFPMLYIKDEKKDIEQYIYEDFILLNYNHHKGIKVDMIA